MGPEAWTRLMEKEKESVRYVFLRTPFPLEGGRLIEMCSKLFVTFLLHLQ